MIHAAFGRTHRDFTQPSALADFAAVLLGASCFDAGAVSVSVKLATSTARAVCHSSAAELSAAARKPRHRAYTADTAHTACRHVRSKQRAGSLCANRLSGHRDLSVRELERWRCTFPLFSCRPWEPTCYRPRRRGHHSMKRLSMLL